MTCPWPTLLLWPPSSSSPHRTASCSALPRSPLYSQACRRLTSCLQHSFAGWGTLLPAQLQLHRDLSHWWSWLSTWQWPTLLLRPPSSAELYSMLVPLHTLRSLQWTPLQINSLQFVVRHLGIEPESLPGQGSILPLDQCRGNTHNVCSHNNQLRRCYINYTTCQKSLRLSHSLNFNVVSLQRLQGSLEKTCSSSRQGSPGLETTFSNSWKNDVLPNFLGNPSS